MRYIVQHEDVKWKTIGHTYRCYCPKDVKKAVKALLKRYTPSPQNRIRIYAAPLTLVQEITSPTETEITIQYPDDFKKQKPSKPAITIISNDGHGGTIEQTLDEVCPASSGEWITHQMARVFYPDTHKAPITDTRCGSCTNGRKPVGDTYAPCSACCGTGRCNHDWDNSDHCWKCHAPKPR